MRSKFKTKRGLEHPTHQKDDAYFQLQQQIERFKLRTGYQRKILAQLATSTGY